MYVLGHVQVFGILGAVAARAGAELGEGVGVTGGTLGAGGLWGAGVEGATGVGGHRSLRNLVFRGGRRGGGGGSGSGCHTVTAVSPRRARRLPDNVPRKGRGGAARGESGRDEERDGFPVGPEHTETWADGDWVVRLVPGSSSGKSYRCPGCDQEIPAGTPHVVAWPTQPRSVLAPGLEERRHWHRACWQRRLHRRPGQRRPR